MKKYVVLVSGGMDSTTLLATCVAEVGAENVWTLSVNYGQRHMRELAAAKRILDWYKIPEDHRATADLRSIRDLLGGSALTSDDIPVPEGHYEAESMRATVVPNRNMIMLSVALGYAIRKGANAVAYGAHAGDHAIYPDCRPVFANAIKEVASHCHEEPLELYTPFLHITKAGIARRGTALGVPFELTWSCYKGNELHCGKCGTCVERREAFATVGITDPTEYEA